jgi:CYTH domain-containing protein
MMATRLRQVDGVDMGEGPTRERAAAHVAAVNDWRRAAETSRYARTELERRFLVVGPVPAQGPVRRIEDRYLTGTTLRLRRVTVDGESVFKLAQKVRRHSSDPATISITNMYLTREEYDVLAVLPGSALVKSRSIRVIDGVQFSIDVFEGALAGLQLAETEVEELNARLPDPPWLGREVTHDDRYSGGRLAMMTAGDFASLGETPFRS